MSKLTEQLIVRGMISATCVLLLFAAITIEIKDDIPRTVCANATLEECNAVQNESHN